MFGLEMPRQPSFKAVSQTAKGSCHCSCQHLGIHWLTGHHFGKMLFTGWLAIYMVCRTHLTFGQKKLLVDSPVSTTWGTISTRCCFWSMATATKSWVSLSAMWTISMASTGRTTTLVRSIRNSSGASCSFSRLTSLRLSRGRSCATSWTRRTASCCTSPWRSFLRLWSPMSCQEEGWSNQRFWLLTSRRSSEASLDVCSGWDLRRDLTCLLWYPFATMVNKPPSTIWRPWQKLCSTQRILRSLVWSFRTSQSTRRAFWWPTRMHRGPMRLTLHLRWGSWWHWRLQMWPAR